MSRPSYHHNPKYLLWAGLVAAVAMASWMFGSWLGGTWTPSWWDAVYGLVGFLLFAVCIIPDVLLLRRQGDVYIRRLNRYQESQPTALRWTILVACVLWRLVVRGEPKDIVMCSAVGAFLGMTTWYFHFRVVWKRMWELYELEKTVEMPPVLAGETPAPRAQ